MTTLTELAERVERGDWKDIHQFADEICGVLSEVQIMPLEAWDRSRIFVNVLDALGSSRDAADALMPERWTVTGMVGEAGAAFEGFRRAADDKWLKAGAFTQKEYRARLALALRAWDVEKGQDDG